MESLSNIFHVNKKNSQVRVCIDYRNRNLATPKDGYRMPTTDMLIVVVVNHAILAFMDGYSGYNQIFVAKEVTHMTTRSGSLGLKVFLNGWSCPSRYS